MRVATISTLRFAKQGLTGLLSGVILSCGLFFQPAFAERYAPELELLSPSEAMVLEEPVITPLEDLMQPEDAPYDMQVQIVSPAQRPQVSSLVGSAQVPVLKGGVEVEKEFVPDVEFEGSHTLQKGESLILIIMDMVASGWSWQGDEFNARLKEAVERDGKVLIPRGALVKGHIVETHDPGSSFGKRGKIVLDFDYILMPDGRKVPFSSEYTKGDNALKAMGRAVGNGIGGTITGAIRGVLVGLRFGGLQGAAATNGATLIAGSGLGAVGGLAEGIARNGEHVLLNEGDEIKVVLQEPLTLPGMILPPDHENEIQAPGLDVAITGYNLGRDPFKVENQITLSLAISNQTSYRFGSFDMALMDEYNNVFAISPFGAKSDMFMLSIPENSRFTGSVSFSVKTPDVRHYLIFYKPYTRDVIAKVSLTEALKKLSVKKGGKPSAANRSRRSSS